MRARYIMSIVLAALLHASTVAAQSATLSGRVTDPAGQPLEGAAVHIAGTRLATETDDNGSFTFPELRPGRYALRVQRLGYAPARVAADVAGSGLTSLVIVLDPRAVELGGLTVIGSETELAELRESLRAVPGSVVLIEADELRGTRQANFQDLLRFTPGVFAQPRFGAADETQLSVRGSGLRNNFHLRGVNVLVNGMPYRNADGFTDFESLELLTAENVQVYKGANAFRFGGATLGGAINIETRTGYTATPLAAFVEGGSNEFLKAQLSSGAVSGPFDYYVSYARTQVDGYREYSAQTRDRFNAHAGWVLSPALDLRAFYLFADVAEDLPGSLTREEFEADPRGTAPANVENQYGRDYTLHHLGIQLRSQLGESTRLDIAPYMQYRDIVHPIFRVIDQVSRDFGVESRLETDQVIAGAEHEVAFGAQHAFGNVDDSQYINEGGSEGALAKDQKDEAGTLAFYMEDRMRLGERLSLVGGLRWSRATRTVTDRFLSDGDQSDQREFTAWLPRLGAIFEFGTAQLYANASRAFEPPLTLELNSLTIPGFVDLDAQDAWQFEVGTRGGGAAFAWDLALYDIEIDNEILNRNVQPFPGAPFTVPSYRNAEKTRHSGVEAGATVKLATGLFTGVNGGDALELRSAYTFSRFRYVDDVEYQHNTLPGAPEHSLQIEAAYRHPAGFTIRPSLEWVGGDYFIDSANTTSNDGWLAFNARADWTLPRLGAMLFVEARNLTDELYSPSVTVDDANTRSFLPADARSIYLGFRWER